MHKSIILLLGLLIFLISVGPSSIMSNTNAMAFEEYGYEYEEADQYENYATNMANDNYYKSQGSDLIKKIKCNNINSNINGDDNTIDLGSGLGVGAESIQDDASANWFGNGKRNNGNFDLDCINNNNNEGGQGQIGPPGPPGPPGINQLAEGTNVYLVTNTTINTDPDEPSIVARAECDPGDFVLNGGYSVEGADNILTETLRDQAITSPPGGGWEVVQFLGNAGVNSVALTVNAYCFDNPPLNTLATAGVSAFQQQSEDSPITSQAIENSPKLTTLEKQPGDSTGLTAIEKITKLKTQWLDLLP